MFSYIVGVGNYLMYDDSIGIRLVEYIDEHNIIKNPQIKLIDLSGNTLNFISYLNKSTNKIIVVDAAKIGLKSGDYKIFNFHQIISEKESVCFSTHESDLIKIIELAGNLDYFIPEIIFFAIEPYEVKKEIGLSSIIQKNFLNYADKLCLEVLSTTVVNDSLRLR